MCIFAWHKKRAVTKCCSFCRTKALWVNAWNVYHGPTIIAGTIDGMGAISSASSEPYPRAVGVLVDPSMGSVERTTYPMTLWTQSVVPDILTCILVQISKSKQRCRRIKSVYFQTLNANVIINKMASSHLLQLQLSRYRHACVWTSQQCWNRYKSPAWACVHGNWRSDGTNNKFEESHSQYIVIYRVLLTPRDVDSGLAADNNLFPLSWSTHIQTWVRVQSTIESVVAGRLVLIQLCFHCTILSSDEANVHIIVYPSVIIVLTVCRCSASVEWQYFEPSVFICMEHFLQNSLSIFSLYCSSNSASEYSVPL